MRFAEGVRGAFDTLRAYPLRAFLTVFGTLTGVAFLVAVISILQGMSRYVESNLIGRFYGYNTVSIRREPPPELAASATERRSRSRFAALTLDDAEWLETRMRTPGLLSAEWSGTADGAVPGGRKLDKVMLSGGTANYFDVRGVRVAEGRPFTGREAERGLAVAVIGGEVADRLFPGTSAVGKRLLFAGISYRVVGVLARQGKLFTISLDRVAVVPARSPLNGIATPRDQVESIAFRVGDRSLLAGAMAEAEGWMRVRKRLRPAQRNEFSVTTSQRALAAWAKVSRVLMVAIPGLVAISLLVSGVVIMNIMLVSVAERTYEIGVRKALGARSRDILLLFVVEAATLSGVGGALGVGMGLAVTGLIAVYSPLPAEVAPWSAVLGLVLGIGVGMVAGVYPARRASRLDPAVALAQE